MVKEIKYNELLFYVLHNNSEEEEVISYDNFHYILHIVLHRRNESSLFTFLSSLLAVFCPFIVKIRFGGIKARVTQLFELQML